MTNDERRLDEYARAWDPDDYQTQGPSHVVLIVIISLALGFAIGYAVAAMLIANGGG